MAESLASAGAIFTDLVIPASTNVNPIEVPAGMLLKAVLVPATWTASNLQIQCSEDGAVYLFLRGKTDSTLIAFNMTSNNWEALSADDARLMAGWQYLAAKLGNNQAAERTVRLLWVTPGVL